MDIIGKYVLKYRSGSLVALDDASGGYPYGTAIFQHAKLWSSSEEAEEYSSKFPREKFTLHRISNIELTDA